MDPTRCVLVVDDEPNVRLVFRTALESIGYAVAEAGDGATALAWLRKSPADLILLDLRMPGIDGIETLRRLRQAGSSTPVVIVTAHGCVPDAVAAMKLGAADVIPKPVSPTTLREAVAEALARHAPDPHGPLPAGPRAAPHDSLFAEDLARTRRAMDRCELDDAEFFLRIADTLDPGSPEVLKLRDDLRVRRAALGGFTYRALRGILP
jgi:DNA-binding response OmpR family regulator